MKDSRQRPASVAHVVSALPVGDPLAAAIAAGETPSPETVAASGSKEGLKPWIACACLAFVVLGISAAVLLGKSSYLFERVPVAQPPEVNVSAWYSGMGLAGLALLLGLTVYAFHTSLGGQPLFGCAPLED